jgi:hypothetical protein
MFVRLGLKTGVDKQTDQSAAQSVGLDEGLDLRVVRVVHEAPQGPGRVLHNVSLGAIVNEPSQDGKGASDHLEVGLRCCTTEAADGVRHLAAADESVVVAVLKESRHRLEPVGGRSNELMRYDGAAKRGL